MTNPGSANNNGWPVLLPNQKSAGFAVFFFDPFRIRQLRSLRRSALSAGGQARENSLPGNKRDQYTPDVVVNSGWNAE
jgi:hypothetical protein